MTDIKALVQIACKAIDDKKGIDIKVLNIEGLSPMADYFVIASATNVNQVQAISNEIDALLSKENIHFKQIEGYDTANWILMDYGDFIVHIFTTESREYYNLERIWRDAKVE